MKKAVINFANANKWYPYGQQRLYRSLALVNWDGHLMFRTKEEEIGAPPHSEVPYAFKPYLLLSAVQLGCTHVLWCDASVFAIRNIRPMFDYLENHSHMFFYNCSTGNWTSDACLEVFGLTRDEAMNVPMLMGICMGFNMTHPTTQKFLEQWLEHARDGKSFPGHWNNDHQEVSKDERCKGHRHDQSVASILAWKLGMELITPHETFFEYYRHPDPKGASMGQYDGDISLVQPHTVMIAQGM